MLRNASGASPFTHQIVFSSNVSIFATPTTPQSEITIKVNGNVAYKGSEQVISGIYMRPNQTLEVEIAGGGEVFCSILEENIQLKGGVSICDTKETSDGIKTEYELNPANAPANADSELLVFIDGNLITDYTLAPTQDKIIFNTPPYTGAEILIKLTKPQGD